jgi:phosphatidate cytidylyltransferase
MFNMSFNNSFVFISTILFSILTFASLVGYGVQYKLGKTPTTINLIQRINSWWIMILFCLPVIYFGSLIVCIFFSIIAFLGLKEFFSLSPMSKGDNIAANIIYFVLLPLQFFLVYDNWYGLYSILIPVYGFFFLAVAITCNPDANAFLERNSKIQWAVMLCVYGISHIPAIYQLEIPSFKQHDTLVLYFLIVAQISDVLQYVCGKLFGKHQLSKLSPSKTWEGLIGGGLLASLVGASLSFMTPFTYLQSWGFSLAIVSTGFFGGLILSATKRSLNAKDWGNMIPGHGGILDRVDSLALSAPIFFHLVRYFYT